MTNHLTAPVNEPPTIAITGAGSIGVAFAIAFSTVGYSVNIHDPDATARARAAEEIRCRLTDLSEHGLLKDDPDLIRSRICFFADISICLDGAEMAVECAPEDVNIKRAIFASLDSISPPNVILASASSALPITRFTSDLPGRNRCLILHPGNPPYLLPVVEIVPAAYTNDQVVLRAEELLRKAGLKPVRVAKEVEGFVFNRLQGALLREAYCLVRDGVATVSDIDTVVRDGLGLRWSVIGPFETVDLNTRGGISSHAQKMGPAYARMGEERGQNDPWTDDLVAKVNAQRREVLPLNLWEERVAWRDRALMKLVAQRRADSKSPTTQPEGRSRSDLGSL